MIPRRFTTRRRKVGSPKFANSTIEVVIGGGSHLSSSKCNCGQSVYPDCIWNPIVYVRLYRNTAGSCSWAYHLDCLKEWYYEGKPLQDDEGSAISFQYEKPKGLQKTCLITKEMIPHGAKYVLLESKKKDLNGKKVVAVSLKAFEQLLAETPTALKTGRVYVQYGYGLNSERRSDFVDQYCTMFKTTKEKLKKTGLELVEKGKRLREGLEIDMKTISFWDGTLLERYGAPFHPQEIFFHNSKAESRSVPLFNFLKRTCRSQIESLFSCSKTGHLYGTPIKWGNDILFKYGLIAEFDSLFEKIAKIIIMELPFGIVLESQQNLDLEQSQALSASLIQMLRFKTDLENSIQFDLEKAKEYVDTYITSEHRLVRSLGRGILERLNNE